jgi:hypothetical protein
MLTLCEPMEPLYKSKQIEQSGSETWATFDPTWLHPAKTFKDLRPTKILEHIPRQSES